MQKEQLNRMKKLLMIIILNVKKKKSNVDVVQKIVKED